MREILDMLREAGVQHAKLSEGGQLLEVTFAHAVPPAAPASDEAPERQSPLKSSARALLAPMPREDANG